jgi:hypothetical protein
MISNRITLLAAVALLSTGCAVEATESSGRSEAAFSAPSPAPAEPVFGRTTEIGESCTLLEEGEAFTRSECAGAGSFRLVVEEGDLRYNLALKAPSGATSSLELFSLASWPPPKMSGGFQSIGSSVEWRVTVAPSGGDVPHAMIARLSENEGADEFLVVAKISGSESCLYAILDGKAPGAEAAARKAGDESRAKRCPPRSDVTL